MSAWYIYVANQSQNCSVWETWGEQENERFTIIKIDFA